MGAEDLVLPMAFGPYELRRLIAAGGMARVYDARLRGPHGFVKRLAIKMVLPEYAADAEFIGMLIDEAKIAVKLTHSNVCQVLDLGYIDGRYYIAMEYVDGSDLHKIVNLGIQKRVPIPFDVVAFVGQEICSGLDYAHAKVDDEGYPLRIVHRDISPANILISMAGEVKIVDFGVAKAASRSQHTRVGVVKGKYQYMSPEQITAAVVDHRSDIFSAGIVLYETIAGQMAYPEDSSLLERIRHAEIRPLTRVRPDTPEQLAEIIARALRRRPQDRYQTAGEFGARLTQFMLAHRAKHQPTRLEEVMTSLFGAGPAAPEIEEGPVVALPSRAEMIERGGSIVRSAAFAQEASLNIDPEEFEQTVAISMSRGRAACEETDEDASIDETLAESHPPPLAQEPQPSSDDDIVIDVDLGFLDDAPEAKAPPTLYLVRDPSGRSAGPFTRAHLHELVLSGEITENDEVIPIDSLAEGAPADTVRWESPGLLKGGRGAESRAAQRLGPPSRSANLDVESTARVFLDLALGCDSGVAIFDRQGAHKEVFLSQGRPIYVSSNLPAEQLGERLVRLGVISRAGLGHGLGRATREGMLLGEALVSLGLVEREHLDASLVSLVRSRLVEIFMWRTGHMAFHPGSAFEVPVHVDVDPFQLIREGVERAAGTEGAVGWLLEHEKKTLVMSGEPMSELQTLGLDDRVLRFLSLFSRPRRITEAIDIARGEMTSGNEIAGCLMLAVQIGHLLPLD